MMLCTISDLYKINRRFQESKDILLMAYERHPGGRLIVYSLCELSIKMGEVVQGIEYYKGKPIAYSLGNYIFSSRTGIGAMLCLSWDREKEVEAALVPFNASAFPVKELEQEKRKEFFRYMERISFGISIDEAGRICYTQDNKPVNEP